MRRVVLAGVVLAPFLYMGRIAIAARPDVFTALPLGGFVLASAVVAVAVMLGQVVTSATAGYAFARLRFAGRDRLFLAYLAVLAVPAIALVLPRFLLMEALGWSHGYAGLISTELVSVTAIFLLRQVFRTLPRNLEDAARLEGAGEWTIFRRVVLPQARSAVALVVVLAFVEQWRSFLWPLVLARTGSPQVLEVGMADLQGAYALSGSNQIAVAALAVLPVAVICVAAHAAFVRGALLAIPTGEAPIGSSAPR